MRTSWLLFGVIGGCCLAQAPAGVQEALRERVTQFYKLQEQGKFRQSEALVSEETRDTYYNMSKAPIREPAIDDIEFAPDFQTAKVRVVVHIAAPQARGTLLPTKVTGLWKLIGGQWFLDIPLQRNTPFGMMTFGKPDGAPALPPPVSIESVTGGAFRVDPQRLVFPAGTEPFTQASVIQNNLPGALELVLEQIKIPGVTLSLSSTTVPAKGQVRLIATYDPKAGKQTGSRQVLLQVQPVNRTIALTLQFE